MAILWAMDEILIGEKKYISSKQAAKLTGYAKDYVGQLCREGRVPARLVGRSWYVLESAIHDHRFSDQKDESTDMPEPEALAAWESPRYEATAIEMLPSVNRLKEIESGHEEKTVSEHLQDSWREWFDRVAEERPALLTTEIESQAFEAEERAEEVTDEKEETYEEEVSVPVRAIYNELPTELLPRPRALSASPAIVEQVVEEREGGEHKRGYMAVFQLAGVGLAAVFALLAVAGSGYLDKYIITNSQVGMAAGVLLYDK